MIMWGGGDFRICGGILMELGRTVELGIEYDHRSQPV